METELITDARETEKTGKNEISACRCAEAVYVKDAGGKDHSERDRWGMWNYAPDILPQFQR